MYPAPHTSTSYIEVHHQLYIITSARNGHNRYPFRVASVLPGGETLAVVLSDTLAAVVADTLVVPVVVADTLAVAVAVAVAVAEGGHSYHTMDSQALHMVDNHARPTLDNCMETAAHFLHNNSLLPSSPHHQTQSI